MLCNGAVSLPPLDTPSPLLCTLSISPTIPSLSIYCTHGCQCSLGFPWWCWRKKGMGWDEKQWKSLNHWLFSLTRHKGSWGNRTVSGCPLRIQQDQKKRQLSKLGPKLLAIGLAEVVRLLVWVCFFFPFFPPSLLRQQNHSYMLLEKD